MRIPTSTIVMGLVTAGVFGIAGYSALTDEEGDAKHRGEDGELDDDADPDLEAVSARLEEEARVAEREAEAIVTLDATIEQLHGEQVASLGKALAGITLGMKDVAAEQARTEALAHFERTNDVSIRLASETGLLSAIVVVARRGAIDVTGELLCERLSERLETAWGEPQRVDEQAHWLNPTTRQRASLHSGERCTLTFDRYVPAKELIGKTPTAVLPISAIGQPSAKLVNSLPVRADLSNATSEIVWEMPGVGAGAGPTELHAFVTKSKVAGIRATFQTSSEGVDELAAKLTADHGEPVEGDVLRWKSRPPITVEVLDDHEVSVLVGTQPIEE